MSIKNSKQEENDVDLRVTTQSIDQRYNKRLYQSALWKSRLANLRMEGLNIWFGTQH